MALTEEQKQRVRDNSRRHYLANREKLQARHRKYYLENKEAMLAKGKEWVKANPDKIKATKERFFKCHPGIQSEYQRRYQKKPHFRLKSKADHANQKAPGKIRLKDVEAVYLANRMKYGVLTCYLCEKPIDFLQDSLDHKMPVTRGGTNAYLNLEVAHIKCNQEKHNSTPEEYFSRKLDKR
jgi:5-methylcytosine-specific restriction endonuclease McrA